MAFYHWMGPAMKATVEGKQKAKEDAQNSRMKEIQMQQILESIAGAQQNRAFGAEEMGWKREDRPMAQKEAAAQLESILLGNAGKGFSNKQQELVNAFTSATQEGKIGATNVENQNKTIEGQIDAQLMNDPLYLQSKKAGLELDPLRVQQLKQSIQFARNAEGRAAANATASGDNIKQIMNKMAIEYANEKDPAKKAVISQKYNELQQFLMSPEDRALMRKRFSGEDLDEAKIEEIRSGKNRRGQNGKTFVENNVPGLVDIEKAYTNAVYGEEEKRAKGWLQRLWGSPATPDQVEKALLETAKKGQEIKKKLGKADPRDILKELPQGMTAPIMNRPAADYADVNAALAQLPPATRNLVMLYLDQGIPLEQALAMAEGGQ